MTNEDLKRFYETYQNESKPEGFVRYDENGEIPGGGSGSTVSVEVGTTSTLDAGQDATVTNSGTSTNVVLNFGIPKGENGEKGTDGQDGADGNGIASITKTGTEGLVDTYTITFTDNTTTTFTVTNGAQGPQGPAGISYLHEILLYSTGYITCVLSIYNSDNTPYTKSTLKTFLTSIGATSAEYAYPASSYGGSTGALYGIYVSNNTLTVAQKYTNKTTQNITIDNIQQTIVTNVNSSLNTNSVESNTLTDTVIQV